MDLTFTAEQEAFRQSVRELFDTKYGREYVRDCDRDHRPPTEAFSDLAKLGALGVNVSQEYGGGGGGAVDMAILLEELGRGFLDLAFWVFRVVSHGGHTVEAYGTEEQKKRFLPGIANGEISVCFALTEPGSGSDAASLRTAAEQTDDGFVVTGEKTFCSGFKVSDYVLTAVRTSSAGRKQEGITTLLIPTDSPGLTARPIETLGHWPLGTTLLHFDHVKVPDEYRIGPLGGGWSLLGDILRWERLCLSAARTGAAQSALDDTIAYVKQREQFGRPISSFQAVSHRVADMAVLVEISRMLSYRYAYRLDHKTASIRDAAILKLYACEAYKTVADLGLQAFGGYGYTMEYDLQRHFRESRLGTIGAGTSEVQRNIIAKTLGL